MASLNAQLLEMAQKFSPLDQELTIAVSVAHGEPVVVSGRPMHTLFLSGTWDADLQIMATLDNVNYAPVGDPITTEDQDASGNVAVVFDGTFQSVRVDTIAFTSGTPAGTLRSQAG